MREKAANILSKLKVLRKLGELLVKSTVKNTRSYVQQTTKLKYKIKGAVEAKKDRQRHPSVCEMKVFLHTRLSC